MPVVEVEVHVRVDGQMQPGFPLTRSLTVSQWQGIGVQKSGADGASYVGLPTVDALTEIDFLILKADQVMGFRFQNQSDAGLVMNASGLMILIDCKLTSGATTNLKVNNNSGSTANVKGIAAQV